MKYGDNFMYEFSSTSEKNTYAALPSLRFSSLWKDAILRV